MISPGFKIIGGAPCARAATGVNKINAAVTNSVADNVAVNFIFRVFIIIFSENRLECRLEAVVKVAQSRLNPERHLSTA
jgi:hypothetical protein